MRPDNRTRIRLGLQPILLALSILAPIVQADGGSTYSAYDSNRDGFLDRQEFIPFAKSRERKGQPNNFWQFERVDRDRDDRISEQEMVDALLESINGRDQ